MEDQIDNDVLQWYRQFTRELSETRDHTTPNLFCPVEENRITEFEKEFGNILPDSYKNFLKLVGEGRLTEDMNGVQSQGYENSFQCPSEMADIIRKKTVEWDIYPEFIDENEIPFFCVGNSSVFVFRRKEGSKVYFPYLDDVYAENFGEFLKRLMKNINFYNEIHAAE